MAQVKIYALRAHLNANRTAISEAIHSVAVDVLKLPAEKRFHRFLPLDPEDFLFPADRSERYTILEISMFSGRTTETKRTLILELFARLEEAGIPAHDLEITIFETPAANWGIRGVPGDELKLNYTI